MSENENCHSCSCHDEHCSGDEKESTLPIGDIIKVGIAAILFILGRIFLGSAFSLLFFLAGALIAGYETFIEGIKNLAHFNFDESLLMSIAVTAAFILGDHSEGAMVAILFALGEILEDVALARSEKSIKALSVLRPDSANLVTNSGLVLTPAEEVAVGSEILIKVGERIPLDGVLLSECAFLDTSMLTGEPLPRRFNAGDEILSGGVVVEKAINIKTTKELALSTVGRILDEAQNSKKQKCKTEKFITRFAKIYTPLVLVFALLLAFLPAIFGVLAIEKSISRALVFLVASCPCALVISVPLAFFAGIGRAGSVGVIIKGSEYVERLSKLRQIIFDKTGTLTLGAPMLTSLKAYGEKSENELLSLALGGEALSNHPYAYAIRKYGEQQNISPKSVKDITETAGEGVSFSYDNEDYFLGKRSFIEKCALIKTNEEGTLFMAKKGKLLLRFTLLDTPRPEAQKTIKALKALGIKKTFMLSGDSDSAAKKVADILEIDEYYAPLSPLEKAKKAEEIKRDATTAFVGDGINDAPVLALSDVGIAMGRGTDAAIECADVVLMTGELSPLPKAIKIAKETIKRVHINVAFALSVKAVVLILGALGFAPLWLAVFADVGVTFITIVLSVRK